MGRLIDLTGHKYGKLTVIERHINIRYRTAWLSICTCGKTRIATGNDMRSGRVRTCGDPLCWERNYQNRIEATKTHEMSCTRLYTIWAGMKRRCNHLHKNYSARGITYCSSWERFEPFRDWALNNGYSKLLTLDRTNTNGNYEPSNCRWISRKEQARNRTDNKNITFKGKTQCLAAWAEELDINTSTLYDRIKRNWGIERAFNTPSKGKYEGIHKRID